MPRPKVPGELPSFKITLACLLSAALSLDTCLADNLKKPVRLYLDHYPPFNIEENDRIHGSNSIQLQMAFAALNIEAIHRVVPWSRAQINARTQPDSCFYSAARTAEREDQYQWVGPLSSEYIALYSRSDRPIHLSNLQEAQHWRVGGQLGDAYVKWVISQGVPVEELGGTGSSLEKLLHNRIDLWVVGSIAGPYTAMLQGQQLVPSYISTERSDLWMACNKSIPAEVIQQLNSMIKRYTEDGTRQQLLERYGLAPAPAEATQN